MKKLFLAVAIVAIAAGSYMAGYAKGQREQRTMALAHALESASFAANSLNSLGAGSAKAGQLLEMQLRAAVERAEAATREGVELEMAVPNLVDGLERARTYAQRINDAELAKRLTALHGKLQQASGAAGS